MKGSPGGAERRIRWRERRQPHVENLPGGCDGADAANREEAMGGVIEWWGDLPVPMKEAIEQFRAQLGAAIDSVDFVKRALDREVHETDGGEGPD